MAKDVVRPSIGGVVLTGLLAATTIARVEDRALFGGRKFDTGDYCLLAFVEPDGYGFLDYTYL